MLQLTRRITLQFLNLRSLWRFVQSISCTQWEINGTKNTLTCGCSEEEIQIAISQFSAALIFEEAGNKDIAHP